MLPNCSELTGITIWQGLITQRQHQADQRRRRAHADSDGERELRGHERASAPDSQPDAYHDAESFIDCARRVAMERKNKDLLGSNPALHGYSTFVAMAINKLKAKVGDKPLHSCQPHLREWQREPSGLRFDLSYTNQPRAQRAGHRPVPTKAWARA